MDLTVSFKNIYAQILLNALKVFSMREPWYYSDTDMFQSNISIESEKNQFPKANSNKSWNRK